MKRLNRTARERTSRRIKFCYTPKHGSWLNVAECELSCLTSQCLSGPPHRRIDRTANRNRSLVRQDECQTTRRRLAIPHRKRPRETETTLPQN